MSSRRRSMTLVGTIQSTLLFVLACIGLYYHTVDGGGSGDPIYLILAILFVVRVPIEVAMAYSLNVYRFLLWSRILFSMHLTVTFTILWVVAATSWRLFNLVNVMPNMNRLKTLREDLFKMSILWSLMILALTYTLISHFHLQHTQVYKFKAENKMRLQEMRKKRQQELRELEMWYVPSTIEVNRMNSHDWSNLYVRYLQKAYAAGRANLPAPSGGGGGVLGSYQSPRALALDCDTEKFFMV